MNMNTNTTEITADKQERIAAGRWQLDPSRSEVAFHVRTYWGLRAVRGHFERFDGHLAIDELGRRSIELRIHADSLATANRRRDKHLRSADFFDCERHPHVWFHSASVVGLDDGRLLVTGKLEVAGSSVEVEVEASIRHSEDEVEISAATEVDQRQLGMSSGMLGMIRPPARLTVHARLRPPR